MRCPEARAHYAGQDSFRWPRITRGPPHTPPSPTLYTPHPAVGAGPRRHRHSRGGQLACGDRVVGTLLYCKRHCFRRGPWECKPTSQAAISPSQISVNALKLMQSALQELPKLSICRLRCRTTNQWIWQCDIWKRLICVWLWRRRGRTELMVLARTEACHVDMGAQPGFGLT